MPRCLVAAVLAFVLAACANVPPQAIAVDRLDIGEAVAGSWKRQTLLNVVRLRYGDAPMFMDVASIINSYSVTRKAGASAQLPSRDDPNVLGLNAEGTWSNTPTVTYQPLVGSRFTTSLLQPIPPTAILRLTQSGWSAVLVFRTVLRSINGLRNASAGMPADPRFRELLAAVDRIQQAGGFDMRLQPRPDGTATVLVLPDATREDAALEAARRQLVALLGVREDATELDVVYGRSPRSRDEIAMITRSMLEIMIELGFSIDLPAADAASGSTLPGRGHGTDAADQPVHIRSGTEAPADAYAAVKYRDHWFWIDGSDIGSKSAFTFMLILFSLAETGQSASTPLVTVPSR
jgi:hypothetical protein